MFFKGGDQGGRAMDYQQREALKQKIQIGVRAPLPFYDNLMNDLAQ
jgi:hypothetical protein